MAVFQHGHLLETVGVLLDLEVNLYVCAPVFAMSFMNLIYSEESFFDDLNVLVIEVLKLYQSME